jgi:hypothetical protein
VRWSERTAPTAAKRAPTAPRLDPVSATTVRRFAWTLAMILAWIALNWSRLPVGGVASMMAFAGLLAAVLAIFFREPFQGPSLTRWDETLAYSAATLLARALA